MSVAARVDGFAEAPRFNPSFQLGNGYQRQESNIRAAALDRIEQGLVFQIADENMFFVFRQIGVVNTVARHVDFFRTPEERQLFFNQFFKYFVFLLVITGDIYRLTKKHRLFQRIVFGFGKGAVGHRQVFAGHGFFLGLITIYADGFQTIF